MQIIPMGNFKSLDIKIGEDDFKEADSLQFCLEAMAKGTIAEGARVEIELAGANEAPQVALELD